MRVALVRGSLRRRRTYVSVFGAMMPPLGLASLAAVVMSRGHEVTLVDAESQGLGVEEVAKKIESQYVQLVAVNMCTFTHYEFGAELAKRIKAEREDVVFVAGGIHATFLYPQVLRNGFDYAVIGEGEETVSELVEALEQGGKVSHVKGLAFIKDGKLCKTDARPPIQNLDSLPLPAYHLFKKDNYKADIFGEGSHIATLETSRGCPYRCEFCSAAAMWGQGWRFKSVDRTLDELKLVKELGYDWVLIVDNNFIVPVNINERKVLFEKIVDRGLDSLNLIAQLRADLVAGRPDIIMEASRAGLRIAFIGLESGSNEVLKGMGKGISTATGTKAIRVLHSNGVFTHGSFVIGAPYESKKQVNRTVKYADQLRVLGIDSVQFSTYTPLPGTDIFHKALSNDRLLTLDWNLYDCGHPVLKTKLSPMWIYLKSNASEYFFFLKKLISDVTARKGKAAEVNIKYAELLENSDRFLARNLFTYAKGFIELPMDALKFWSKLRKAEKPEREIEEILNLTANFERKICP
jgi:anaerobic magnesium-protoporphyrin IX monomethyl ester cyclase